MMLISVDPKNCTGCRACELACSLFHYGECRPSLSHVQVVKDESLGVGYSIPRLCMQCTDTPCVQACPKKAMHREDISGLVLIKDELCTGCRLCLKACPIGAINFPAETKKAAKCDMCAGNPQCVQFCENQALRLLPAEDFIQPKSTNIAEAYSSARKINITNTPIAGEVRI